MKKSLSFALLVSFIIILKASVFTPAQGELNQDDIKINTFSKYDWEIIDIIPLEAILEVSYVAGNDKDLVDMFNLEDLLEFPVKITDRGLKF